MENCHGISQQSKDLTLIKKNRMIVYIGIEIFYLTFCVMPCD